MNRQDNKIVSIIGTIVEIAIILAIVCGALECFGVNTRVIGSICAIIPMLFMVIFVIWQIIRGLNK